MIDPGVETRPRRLTLPGAPFMVGLYLLRPLLCPGVTCGTSLSTQASASSCSAADCVVCGGGARRPKGQLALVAIAWHRACMRPNQYCLALLGRLRALVPTPCAVQALRAVRRVLQPAVDAAKALRGGVRSPVPPTVGEPARVESVDHWPMAIAVSRRTRGYAHKTVSGMPVTVDG